ncbi:MAG: arsenate reductase [Candidatus Rokuibacteriota bacterium]|nr:MAG: arsenate reductase [Candidatus Rokubacteria bacterium]
MTVHAQIFGFTDCQETRKAQRFFKERGVTVHFVDMKERPAARGELRRFEETFGAAALIDREGARFKALGLRVAGDSPQRLLEKALTEPRLLRTPLVRCGGRVAIGHAPEAWQMWIDAEKQGTASQSGGKPA